MNGGKMDTQKQLLEELENHPMVTKLREEKAAETLAARQKAAEAISAIAGESKKTLPPLADEEERLRKELETTEAKAAALQINVKKIHADRQKAKLTLSQRKNKQVELLLATYDPRIDETLNYFQDKLDELRRPDVIETRKAAGKLNPVSLKKPVEVYSNIESIKKAIEYCMSAIKEVEAMKMEPEYPEERVRELMENIPTIADFSLLRVEKSEDRQGQDLPKVKRTWTDILLDR
jgi:chromosome segregation ATPase